MAEIGFINGLQSQTLFVLIIKSTMCVNMLNNNNNNENNKQMYVFHNPFEFQPLFETIYIYRNLL